MSKQEQNSRNKKIVNDLLKQTPGNKLCADCNARGPQWASTTQGVFFCIRCAGLHRKLGTHISKVRSVGLDSWNDEQTRMVQLFGNDKANAIFEAKLDREKPTADTDTATVEKFIRAKYERKVWIDSEAYAREYGNVDLSGSEDSSPVTTPTTPLKQSISTQNFNSSKQTSLRSVSSQDDVANPPPQKRVPVVKQEPIVKQTNTPSLISFEDTPKNDDLSQFIIMDNNQSNQRGPQTSGKDSVLSLFEPSMQPNTNNNVNRNPPPQQFSIPNGPPPLMNGMGRGMPPPINNGMNNGMNGMGRGMYPPPINNNGMMNNGPPPMMGRGYPPQGFNNGMMMNGPPPLNNGMGMMMNGPPPLNNGMMGMGMNGPPPLNNGMMNNGPPPINNGMNNGMNGMGRGYPPQYNNGMRF